MQFVVRKAQLSPLSLPPTLSFLNSLVLRSSSGQSGAGVHTGAGGGAAPPWLLGFTALDKASHTQKWRWALGLCPCHQSPWDSCWG